jgi:hypothetical protein
MKDDTWKEEKAKTVAAFATLTEEMDYMEMLAPKKNGRKAARD